MADVQIAVIDPENTQLALAAPAEAVVNVAVPGIQGPVGTTGSVTIAQAGTAATPGIRFESDTNTGVYSPGADQLALSTAGNGRLFIDGTGFVGIGTVPNAGYGLDVRGLTRILSVGGSSGLEIGTGTATNQFAFLDLVGDATYVDYGLRLLRGNTGANANSNIVHKGTGPLLLITEEAGPIVLATSNAERVRIDSIGRLLVGTSSIITEQYGGQGKVQIAGTDNYNLSTFQYANNNFANVFTLGRSRSTSIGHTIVQSGDGVGQIRFQGSDGTGFITTAEILASVDGTPGTNDMPGRLVFSTTADGASSPTERMRIKSTGTINFSSVAVYADNAAAITGGLAVGDVYRTSTGQLMIRY